MPAIRPPQASAGHRGNNLAAYLQSYWRGAVEFGSNESVFGPAARLADGIFTAGVASFWLRWEPADAPGSGFPTIGQNGPTNMMAYFGTDPAFASIGSIEVQLVPLTRNAHWFAMEDSGLMWSSADGVNWSSFQGPINGGSVNAVYGNGMWVLWGLEYASDEVFVQGIALATTDLFHFDLVDREGAQGGSIDTVSFIEAENRFKLQISGRYGQGVNPIFMYHDNPFPPGSFEHGISIMTPPPPNDYTTYSDGKVWMQFRGAESNNEIWASTDQGQTWNKVAETLFATCAAPWGFNSGLIGGKGGSRGSTPSAPGTIPHLIPVGDFHKMNQAPPVTWEVSYFTKGFDASIGQGGAGIHVTRFGLPNPGNPVYDNNTAQMRVHIQDINDPEWGRQFSGSPPGGNYLEYCGGGGTYGGGTDDPNSEMISQCLAGFNFAVANPQLFVIGDVAAEGQKYEFPSLHGYYPLG